jgi:hypothetical protein
MSTPDALPTEIALIALPSFKFQVYLTSLHRYYHRPITLSTFRLPYQPTIDHMVLINALQSPLKKFFCPQDWHLTHTQYSLTQPQLLRVQSQHLPSTSISFPELILLSRHVPTIANPKVCQLTSTVLGQLFSSALRRATQW